MRSAGGRADRDVRAPRRPRSVRDMEAEALLRCICCVSTKGRKRMKKFIAFIVIIVLVIGVKMFYIDRNAQKQVDLRLEQMHNFVDLKYGKAKVDLIGWNTHLKNVTISPAGTKAATQVEDVIIYDLDREKEIPTHLHIAFKGLNMEVNRDNFGDGAENLQRMGYKKIQGSLEIGYDYDLEKKAFHLKTFRVGAEDVGHVSAEVRLSNIDLSSVDVFSFLLSFPQILLHNAELRYEDDSLVSRMQKLAAEEQGKSVDELVKEMTDAIDKEIENEENKFTKDALKAVKKFIKDPDEIKIVISPKEPVSAGIIQKTDPKALPELLNIEIKT
jgi:preprotein translocase subunit YajC